MRSHARSYAIAALMGLSMQSVLLAQESSEVALPRSFRLTAGESRSLTWPESAGTIAKVTSVRVSPSLGYPFRVETSGTGGLKLVTPPATPPGAYGVEIAGYTSDGRSSSLTFQVTIDAVTLPRPAVSARVPVILLNGFQLVCTVGGSDSTLAASVDTFGQLAILLQSDGVPVAFFNNCTYGNLSIEQLAAQLNTYLATLRYTDGTPIPQVDLVVHSMGGLIARAYLSGKSQTSGMFAPPINHKVRKLVTLATPHFGSFQASYIGAQESEMTLGSQFLWDLATWNQGQDDLRGVDALAVIGNAGSYGSALNASDGVVSLTSGSLSFTRPDQRTRIVPYCHTTGLLSGLVMSCSGHLGIANITDSSHLTAQIVRSFLADTTVWQSIGTPPSLDALLRTYGGAFLTLKGTNDVYFTDLTSVKYDNGAGPLEAGPSSAVASVYYTEFLAWGQHTFSMAHSNGQVTTGTGTLVAGASRGFLFKFGPIITGVQSTGSPGLAGLTVESGSTIMVSGAGFSASGTQLLANGTPLSISSLSDQQITAFLPTGYSGLVHLTVKNGNGQHTVNIMAAPAVQPATPLLTIVKTHSGSFTQGQTGSTYTVTVSNSPSAGPTNGTVIVTEAVPAGLLLVSMSGAGWSCSGSTCSRSDVLSPGSSYPPITAVVNVSSNAPSLAINQVTVSSGGSPSATASDATTILSVAGVPQINTGGVVNGASYNPDATISPGSISSAFGSSLAPRTAAAIGVPLPTSLGGAQLLINGTAAPLFFASPTQLNFQLPPDVSGAATLQVVSGAVTSPPTSVNVAVAAPGIFTVNSTGQGQGAVLNSDFSANSPANPSPAGSTIMVYCTGLGAVSPALAAGLPGATAEPFNRTVLTPIVTIGGANANVPFSAIAPGFVGLYQVNVVLPGGVTGDSVTLKINAGGRDSNTVTIAVR